MGFTTINPPRTAINSQVPSGASGFCPANSSKARFSGTVFLSGLLATQNDDWTRKLGSTWKHADLSCKLCMGQTSRPLCKLIEKRETDSVHVHLLAQDNIQGKWMRCIRCAFAFVWDARQMVWKTVCNFLTRLEFLPLIFRPWAYAKDCLGAFGMFGLANSHFRSLVSKNSLAWWFENVGNSPDFLSGEPTNQPWLKIQFINKNPRGSSRLWNASSEFTWWHARHASTSGIPHILGMVG